MLKLFGKAPVGKHDVSTAVSDSAALLFSNRPTASLLRGSSEENCSYGMSVVILHALLIDSLAFICITTNYS